MAVIKLRQVDHVKNERWILADVAGHPFITNLIASFSDHDSLYMLVNKSYSFYLPNLSLHTFSLNIALVVKFLLISVKLNASTKIVLASTLPR